MSLQMICGYTNPCATAASPLATVFGQDRIQGRPLESFRLDR